MTMDADTGTGQQIQDYKVLYDKPDDVVMAETGLPLVAVWAIKDAMMSAGLELQYPPPEGYNRGWHKVG
jgi:hypothetical protein